MSNTILNDTPLHVFVILAETLSGWKSPATDEGKAVLMEHYDWGAKLKAEDKLILAGPTDFELISTNQLNAIGHTTGLIMLKATSREEAEAWAYQDPFHTNGFRRNVVYSLNITMTEPNLFTPLQKIIKQ